MHGYYADEVIGIPGLPRQLCNGNGTGRGGDRILHFSASMRCVERSLSDVRVGRLILVSC